MTHRAHEVEASGGGRYFACIACPWTGGLREAIAHAVGHQFNVGPSRAPLGFYSQNPRKRRRVPR